MPSPAERFGALLRARARRVRWLAIPLAAYLVITLVLPAANGAAARAEFVTHATWVLAACGCALGIIVVGGALLDIVRRHHARSWRRP